MEALTDRPLNQPRLKNGYHNLAFFPDSRRLLFVSMDGTAPVWDVQADHAEWVLGRPGDFAKWHLGITRDGRWLAGEAGHTAVALWDLEHRERLVTMPEARSSVTGAAWSPDGNRLAVAHKDGEVVVWSLPEIGARLAELGLDWPDTRAGGPGASAAAEAERVNRLDAEAREAEAGGDAAAALAALDRLAEARPGDALPLLRRARALAAAGQADRAEAEVRRALAVGPRDRCLDALSAWAADARRAGAFDLALWATGRALAERPDDARARGARVLAFHQSGQADRRDAAIAEALRRSPDRPFLRMAADLRAGEGRWAEAADLVARERRSPGPASPEPFVREALARLLAGDTVGYRRLCRELLAAAGPRPSSALSNYVAWVCALGPGALEGVARERVVGLAEDALAAAPPGMEPGRRHAALNTLGAVLHRAGRDREAVARLREGIAVEGGEGSPSDWLFLALAYHGLGDRDAAARWFARASRPAPRPPGATVWEAAELEVVRREAAGLLLDAAFPADPFAH